MVDPQMPDKFQSEPQLPVAFLQQILTELSEKLAAEGTEVLRNQLVERKLPLQDVTLLVEYVAQLEFQPTLNRLVQAFKWYVDKQYPEWRRQTERLEATHREEELRKLEAFRHRFEEALIRIKERRESYEQRCKENAEKARALLEELKKIVLAEQLDAFPRVRRITREWSLLRKELLPQDRKELVQPFKEFIARFDAQYERYKDLIEEEREAILQRKRQILQEIQQLFPPEGTQATFEFWQKQRDRLALLQSEWQSLPRVGSRQESELVEQYRQLVYRFRERYNLFRSQAYQRVQKDPVLQEAYRRKNQILELLRPLVAREYASLDAWKEANRQVRELVREWRAQTERSLGQDDSKEVRRFYAPLNQQFSELLDTFNEKSERFNQEYRSQQIRRIVDLGKKLIQEVQNLLQKDLSGAVQRYRAQVALWKRRAHRFHNEPAVAEVLQELSALGEKVREAQKAYVQKLNENLERRIELLNRLDELGQNAIPESLDAFIETLIAYDQAGEVAASHRDRLHNRHKQAIQRFLSASGLSEEAFQEAWLTAQVAHQSPQQIRRTIDSVKAQIARYKQDLQGYQNTLALLAKGKGSEPLRQELEQKMEEAQRQIKRAQEMLKRLQQRLQSANASSAPSA